MIRKDDREGQVRKCLMQYKVELYVQGGWVDNTLRFDTFQKAENYGGYMMSEWIIPTKYRVVEVKEETQEQGGKP